MTTESAAMAALLAENARLVALLEAHGIDWQIPPATMRAEPPALAQESSKLSTDEKIAIFRRLFAGRTDVYPIRWESKAGKSGYSPACANEWRAGVCEKPRIKCSDCGNRSFLPLTDQVIYDHLAGHHTVGIYPLRSDDTCCFLAVDFDEADWCADALAFVRSCRELNVPVALEVSRSGSGAPCVDFLRRPCPGTRGSPTRYRYHQSYLRARAAAQAFFLRPDFPESGRDAKRRFR